MKEQIDKLISNGMNQLAQQLGQMTQQPVIGTQPRATMPMTRSMSDTVTIPSLIDLDAPREQMSTPAIPLSGGSGPLANLQVDQKLAELKRGRQRDLEAWIDTEWADFSKFKEKMEGMTESLLKSRYMIKTDKAQQKIALLHEMMAETMDIDDTSRCYTGNVITEFMGRWQVHELELSRHMFDLMKQESEKTKQENEKMKLENEKLTRRLIGHAPQATDDTASVASASQSAWECVTHPNV